MSEQSVLFDRIESARVVTESWWGARDRHACREIARPLAPSS